MEISGLVFYLLASEMVYGITLSRISSIPTYPYIHPSLTDCTDISELLEQALIEQLQPVLLYPSNNYKRYHQMHTTQPQVISCQQNIPNTYHAKANQCNQCNLNRIVSNPFVQDIISSSLKLNEPARVENPIKASKNIFDSIPQVVNNYIIVPPEYMQSDDRNRKLETDLRGSKRAKKNNCNGGNKRKNTKKLSEYKEPVSEKRNICENSGKKNTAAGIKGERGQKRKIIHKIKETDQEKSENSINHNDIKIKNETTVKNITKDEAFIQDFSKRFPSMSEEDIKSFLSFVRNRLKKQGQNNLQSETLSVSESELSIDDNHMHQTQDSKNNKKRHTNRKTAQDTTDNYAISKNLRQEPSAEDKFYNAEDIISNKSSDDAKAKTNTKYNQNVIEIEKTSLNLENSIDLQKNAIDGDKVIKKPIKNEVAKNKNGKHRTRPNTVDDRLKKQSARGVSRKTHKGKSGKISTNRFRTPPTLERPGFRTKKLMKKNFKDTEGQYEKYCTYSDIKQNSNTETYFKESEKKETKIETCFGHSKVAKYGTTDDKDEDYEAHTITYYIPDSMEFEDDGKSVIVTRRIPNTFGSK